MDFRHLNFICHLDFVIWIFIFMQWKQPKNTDKYYWTAHVAEKMHYYGLSEQKILGVIRKPQRIETGIVENTVAVMMPVGNIKKNKKPSMWNRSFNDDGETEKWSQEIWVMYQLRGSGANPKIQDTNTKKILNIKSKKNKQIIIENLKSKISNSANRKLYIISAWRYPGVSPKKNPIPEEILREIEEIGLK